MAVVVLDQVLLYHIPCLWEKQGAETGIFAEIIKKTDEGISSCTRKIVPVRWSMSSDSKPLMQAQTETLNNFSYVRSGCNTWICFNNFLPSLPISSKTLEFKCFEDGAHYVLYLLSLVFWVFLTFIYSVLRIGISFLHIAPHHFSRTHKYENHVAYIKDTLNINFYFSHRID